MTGRAGLARRARRLALAAAGLLAIVTLATILSGRPGEPALRPTGEGDVRVVHLVSHGWHSGLVLPRDALTGEGAGAALGSVATRFGAYPAIEFGWGEARFYRATPSASDLDGRLALAALFTPGGRDGVVHVVGLPGDPRGAFPGADILAIRVSAAGLARLLARLEAAFRLADGRPVDEGTGLYGPSLFYAGAGRFSYANLCNHWSADLLNAAGLPVLMLPATHPIGLFADLAWRSGAEPIPRRTSAPGSP